MEREEGRRREKEEGERRRKKSSGERDRGGVCGRIAEILGAEILGEQRGGGEKLNFEMAGDEASERRELVLYDDAERSAV
eukprot:750004-Hanusia_phi.AAC.4